MTVKWRWCHCDPYFRRSNRNSGRIMFDEMESRLSCSLYSMGEWGICYMDCIWYSSPLFLFIRTITVRFVFSRSNLINWFHVRRNPMHSYGLSRVIVSLIDPGRITDWSMMQFFRNGVLMDILYGWHLKSSLYIHPLTNIWRQ